MNRFYRCVLNVTFFGVVCFGSMEAKHTYGNLHVTKVDRVHDGDTFIVSIEGVHPIIGHEVSVRINGIDAPEITDHRPEIKALAVEARDFVAYRLSQTKNVELIDLQRDKYFRLLADVYLDGVNLGDELIEAGLAHPYDGHTKPLWE